MLNAQYWANWSRSVFRRQISVFRDVVFHRLVRTFDSVEEEADKVSEDSWKQLCASAGPDSDPASAAESALDAGIAHYLALTGIPQGLLNLFAVGLHHLVEQQQLVVLRQELTPRNSAPSFEPSEFVQHLKKIGINVETFSSWPSLVELRYLANAVKHAEGNSAQQLRQTNPHFFEPPCLDGSPQIFSAAPVQWLFQPIVGQDLYTRLDDLAKYFGQADTFWQEFEESLFLHQE